MALAESPSGAPILELQVEGLHPRGVALLKLEILHYVGGNATKHVYQVRVLNERAAAIGLKPGDTYCLKICRPRRGPWGALSRRLGVSRCVSQRFMSRGAAIWQKIIRRAALYALGSESFVANVFATFYDRRLRWYGTVEEWVEGRLWHLEIDDHLFDRPRPAREPDYRLPESFPLEFTAKRFFLARFERLLREMGARGLARRYAWSSWTAQRKVFLRAASEQQPYAGLVAIDFEYAPGSLKGLDQYIASHKGQFEDLSLLVDELLGWETGADQTVPVPAPATVMIPQVVKEVWNLASHWNAARAPDRPSVRQRLDRALLFPIRLFFREDLRKTRLLDLVAEGQRSGTLSEAEADRIREQIPDPYIQVYLKCLAVHLCLLPTTPVLTALGGLWFALAHHMDLQEGMEIVAKSLAFFAVSPLSPGSLARGLYVVLVALRRREFKRFRVALILSFWRYVGYLAFPLQMVRTFPALARFMAARWATQAVHLVPVLGRRGNLLEHAVFDLFFNFPLTVGRRLRERRAA